MCKGLKHVNRSGRWETESLESLVNTRMTVFSIDGNIDAQPQQNPETYISRISQ